MYDTLQDFERPVDNIVSGRTEDTTEQKEWARKVILKFDEIKVKEKNVNNFHTNEIIEFEEDVLNIDVLRQEFNSLHQNSDEQQTNITSVAKHILLFMIQRWDKKETH